MAIAFHSLRACHVKIDANNGANLQSFGYTEDGADSSFETFVHRVKTDKAGGSEAVDFDQIDLGQRAIISLVMVQWDTAVADKIAAFVAGGTAGSPADAGTIYQTGTNSSNNYFFRLLLHTTNQPINFPVAMPIGSPITMNRGVKHPKLKITFECYKNSSGVLYNATTS